MRKTEKRVSPAKEYDAEIEIKCDLCGATTGKRLGRDGLEVARDGWGVSAYDHDEITVSRRQGTHYPEGGYDTTFRYDVCPRCWEMKVLPWFAAQGAMLTETTTDF